MKGSLLIVILISLLIAGILVMKNIGGGSGDEAEKSKIETMNQARDKADDAQKHLQEVQKRMQQTE